jgi:hypothetical protein
VFNRTSAPELSRSSQNRACFFVPSTLLSHKLTNSQESHNLDSSDQTNFTEVLQTMKFSFNTCHFVLLVAAASNAVTSAARMDLGNSCNFAAIGKSGITNVPNAATSITGDIGVSPADASNVFSTSAYVDGQCFAADYAVPTPANMGAAVYDMMAAYTAGNNRLATFPDNISRSGAAGGTIGGETLYPGVYKFTVVITIDTDITLDAQDDPDAEFTITTTGELYVAAGKKVLLAGGAKAENIYWHVAGYVHLLANSHVEGNILTYTKIDMITGSTVNGRLLAQTAVNMDSNTVTIPAGCGEIEIEEEDAEAFCA